MSNMLSLGKVLHTLQIPFQQDNEYIRCYCPMHHSKEVHRPSGSFNLKTGAYKCFNCGAGSKDLENFLLDLELDLRYQMKKHPEQIAVLDTKFTQVKKALERLKDAIATNVPTTA